MCWKSKITGFLGFFEIVPLSLLLVSQSVCAPGYITIGIRSQPPCVNINQSYEPITIHCFIAFEGASALPYTIFLNGTCDVGDVYLTQYVFIFHYSEMVPFDAIMYIEPEIENGTQGWFTLAGYLEIGGLVYPINPVSQMIMVFNYDPDYAHPVEKGLVTKNSQYDMVLFYGLSSLLLFFTCYLTVLRPRLKEYKRR